jgi:hypothetical protein
MFVVCPDACPAKYFLTQLVIKDIQKHLQLHIQILYPPIKLVKEFPYSLQILLGIHARNRRFLNHCNTNTVAVPQRTQLLQRLELFDGGWLQLFVNFQERGAVGIDTDMSIDRQPVR